MIQALLGRKLGMTRLFDENGVVTASTLVEAGPCFITQLKTEEVDGYTAVQLAEAVRECIQGPALKTLAGTIREAYEKTA